ncbi:sensor histidine kinase [Thalassotalea euphylliae]|uniref:histidine kinase n=1 Tax=Thalassotalea euphylliae TaxID=1655234 RepID=A0A3E0TLI2_9GAMM|nr:HAMP domain-containing sensor histidine kinase [Thalassotalea euphylliae]REL25419.1 sensor histidine kinase [Thalassotalea euphylliae]
MARFFSWNVPQTVPQKTAWFFLPWLLWLTCLVAIFFLGDANNPIVWAISFGYALILALMTRYLDLRELSSTAQPETVHIVLSLAPFILDLCFYGVLLQLHGGASNAGVFILYLPVIVASMEMKRRIAWFVAMLAITIYTLLMLQGHAAHFEHLSESFTNHLSGMWLTFVISTLLMTWFVTQQRQAIIGQQKQIRKLRERQLRDEQILSVATMGANTTHRLATPLSTARLLVDELNEQKAFEQSLVDELSAQIHVCHQTVHTIAQQVRSHQSANMQRLPIDDFIQQTLQYWWISRNDIRYQLNVAPQCADYALATDFNLQMSLTNLLENAAYASLANQQDEISIEVAIKDQQVVINIDDQGQGIDPQLMSQLGQVKVSSKPQGMGMGLALANATIERFAGQLQLFNLPSGSRSQVVLPCQPLAAASI